MSKRSFIRVFWGTSPNQINDEFKIEISNYIKSYYNTFVSDDQSTSYVNDELIFINKDRLNKVKSNISMAVKEKFQPEFVCYTFGEDNHKFLKDIGVNSILINKFSNPYYLYRHKMEAWKCGMSDFDEIVFLDWDTKPIKPIDDNFWNLLNNKSPIQSSLTRYSSRRLSHRGNRLDNKWMPSAQFVYFRDKSLVDRAIELWKHEEHRWAEEPGLARLIDEMMGGWNIKKYEEYYETDVFTNVRNPFKKDISNIYFSNLGHPWRY